VPAVDPCDQCLKYLVVDIVKDLLGYHVTVVVGPAPYLAIELLDQFYRLGRLVGFDESSDVIQEALNC
jgi:hypothetical protein